jgi:hypothetical protein
MKSKKLQLYKTIELNKNAPSWTKKVPNGFLVNLFTLFVKFMYRTIPTKSGAHGVGEDVSVTVPEYLMIDFIKHFDKVKPKYKKSEKSVKSFPFTGEEYLQIVWNFTDLQDLNDFFSIFKNLEVSTDIL